VATFQPGRILQLASGPHGCGIADINMPMEKDLAFASGNNNNVTI
jgi:hypothetical protein